MKILIQVLKKYIYYMLNLERGSQSSQLTGTVAEKEASAKTEKY